MGTADHTQDGLSGDDPSADGVELTAQSRAAILTALAARVPAAAAEAVKGQSDLDPELRDALLSIVSQEASASLLARKVGDLLRSRGEGRLPASNEFYRAAFYLGDEWSTLASNPLFAWFSANKAGQPMDKWIHYFDIYRRALAPYVGKDVRVLEIGVFHGGGLDLLGTYLGPGAELLGVDCDESARAACNDRFRVAVGDQSDTDFLLQVSEEFGPFDVIIDDGGHTMGQQITSIEALFPLLRDGGIYLVEDTHTSYWPEYQDHPQTFMDWVKDRVDDLNGFHHRQERNLPIWTTDVSAISVFDSITVFEKHARFAPFTEVTGTGSALLSSRTDETNLLHYRAAANVRGAELEQTRKVQQEAMSQLSTMGSAWAEERRGLQEQQATLTQQREELMQQHEELTQQGEALTRQQVAANEALAQTLAELQQTQQALGQTHGDLQAMRTSTSWRMTTPLRRLSRRFKS